MQAQELMTRGVETVGPDQDVGEVLTRMASVDFNGFPVVEDAPGEAEDRTTSTGFRAHGRLVGVVTQRDLVDLFQPSDRTLWIPVGFPPFLETVTYGVDLSWDDLDVGVDLARNAGKPVREVMTGNVITVGPDADLDEVLDVLADDDRDVNRVPVVEEGQLVGIVTRQDVLQALRDERRRTRPEP